MATRTRLSWKLDSQGQFSRQIGWKLNAAGRRVQHKFRLGSDLTEARRREQRLRELWERIETVSATADPTWDELSLEIGRQLAKGAEQVVLESLPAESDESYAGRLHHAESRFPSIRFQPGDVARYAAGSGRETFRLSDCLVWPVSPREEYERLLEGRDTMYLVPRENELPPAAPAPVSSLHLAMDDYVAWVREHYHRDELGHVSGTGHTKIKQIETLKDRHDDVSLDRLGFDEVERMIFYWRRRPPRKLDGRPVSRSAAENYIGELKRFLKWLHRSPRHHWRKPEDFDGIDTTVDSDHAQPRRRLAQALVFTREELVLLNRHATPLDRLLLLLGLNCGFGVAEIASLTVDEVRLRQGHSARHRELMGYETTDADSFVTRVRHKSGVYGEFLLFGQTVEALEWALRRRRAQPGFGPVAPLLLNGRNERFDKPTANGNRNQQIPNAFARLRKRIVEAGEQISELSFGKLRKTAGDLVRRFGDGEVAGVFLCHGKPVATDDLSDQYTNRPFGKVFATLRQVEEFLQPVFQAAGPAPFQKSG
jgi:integrase